MRPPLPACRLGPLAAALLAAIGPALARGAARPGLPLALLSEVALPGRATRFDYQDVDAVRGLLFIAHMGDGEVIVVSLRDGSTVRRLRGIGTVRGILVAPEAGLAFATAAATNQLVRIDLGTLSESGRAPTGNGPDGIGWDPVHRVVAVSDQRDGAVSLIAGAGAGARTQVRLGRETGNVVHDRGRGCFWVAVEMAVPPDQLVSVDPLAGAIRDRIALPGCRGAHGLRLHPDGGSALVACEGNDLLLRVGLDPAHSIWRAPVGSGPDVLAVDPGLGWLYVAAEGGDLTVLDIGGAGLSTVGRERPGAAAHTVALDPATHRVFIPLPRGSAGRPALRIMRPAGVE